MFLVVRTQEIQTQNQRHCRSRCYGKVYTYARSVHKGESPMHICGYILYQRVGIILCHVYSTGFPRTLTTNMHSTDTPLSFLQYAFDSLIRVFGRHNYIRNADFYTRTDKREQELCYTVFSSTCNHHRCNDTYNSGRGMASYLQTIY